MFTCRLTLLFTVLLRVSHHFLPITLFYLPLTLWPKDLVLPVSFLLLLHIICFHFSQTFLLLFLFSTTKIFCTRRGKKNQGPDISLTSCGNEVATFFLLCWCIDFLYHRISAVLREEWYAFAVWSLVVWLGFAPGAWYVR